MGCADACAVLYDCGALTCNGTKLCQGFTGAAAEKMTFIGDANGGCVQMCNDQTALGSVVDPSDCKGTVLVFNTLFADFQAVCTTGFAGGGN